VAAIVMLGAYAAKAWGWQRLFRREQRPAVLTLAAAGGAASVGGLALPGRCDEVIRFAVVRRCRRRRASIGAVALSLFLLGLLDSAAMTPLASVALGGSRIDGWRRVGFFVGAGAAMLVASGVRAEEAVAFGVAAQALLIAVGAMFVLALGAWHAQGAVVSRSRLRYSSGAR
jgi:hypothetical protein